MPFSARVSIVDEGQDLDAVFHISPKNSSFSAKLLSPEKVYLHTDKDTYFATDTIWISGYVENASYNSEFPESNYIYVELISDQLYTDFTSRTK